MKEEVLKVLAQIRPALQADGGDVELVEITEDGIVKVRLKGACGSCPMSTMTLKMALNGRCWNKSPRQGSRPGFPRRLKDSTQWNPARYVRRGFFSKDSANSQ